MSVREAPTGTMSATLRALVEFAERRGVDVGALIAASPLDRAEIEAPLARLPVEAAGPLFAQIIAASGDPLLHLRLAPEIPMGAFAVIDFLASSAATLGEGYRALCRYFTLVHAGIALEEEAEGGEFRVVCRSRDATGDGSFPLAICASRFVMLCGPGALPRRVELSRGPIGDAGLARRLFGRAVVYHAARDVLVFDAAQWALALPGNNPMLRAVLEQHAESLRRDLARPDRLADRVADALRPLLGQGRAEVRFVAARLGLSARTLQRRLRAEGTAFAAVVDETRQALAEVYLADRSLTVLEVAIMLGYADESAFHRAFKRWFGARPGEWRAARG
ncbi:MAG: AraC family transcriptional regulator ligand-binding domain-containing protein [Myxococcales bacterium]|nr:AraC family transcriptional regulator ligand-binding domain-containing protein [Myxococcales bacterium]